MTTRIALIADIHGDARALEDALEQIDRLGCDHILCAGDLVGYGRSSEEVVHLIRERHILCCRGNHDRWAVDRCHPEDPSEERDDALYDAMGLDLGRGSLRFLAGLPFGLDMIFEGVRITVLVSTSMVIC